MIACEIKNKRATSSIRYSCIDAPASPLSYMVIQPSSLTALDATCINEAKRRKGRSRLGASTSGFFKGIDQVLSSVRRSVSGACLPCSSLHHGLQWF